MEVFSPPRRVLTEWISKNGSILCRNQSPFLFIDSIKSLFGDWLHWKPPSALDYSCTVPISFFTVQRYGHLFYYTARCKAWSLNIRDHPFFLRIMLCTDSRTSVWVLGIALLFQISVITLVVPFWRSVFSHQDQNACFVKSENKSAEWSHSTCSQLPIEPLIITCTIILVQRELVLWY